jgi:CspA family cold shock protein
VTELARGAARRGVVRTFDEAAGLGVIDGEDGVEYAFHCIEIADGTRTIDPGAEVGFDRLAKLGRWEAANVRP